MLGGTGEQGVFGLNKTLTERSWSRVVVATGSCRSETGRDASRSAVDGVGRFLSDERGATAVEYGIIVAGIAAVLVGALGLVGSSLSGHFNTVATTLAK